MMDEGWRTNELSDSSDFTVAFASEKDQRWHYNSNTNSKKKLASPTSAPW